MARDGERGDRKAWLGARNSGPYAGGTGDTGPVDIAAVRRDDALIDAIASDGPVQTDSPEEFQLAALLADWRAEVVAPPLPAAPDLDELVAAVNQEIGARKVRVSPGRGGRLRLVRPLAGAAAALALVFGGMTAFSYNAEPGDPLWRVKEVVFSEQAQTTVVARADDELAQVQAALAQGDNDQARVLLDRVRNTAQQVDDPAKQDDLIERWNALVAELGKVAPDIASQITSTQSRPSEPKPSAQVPTTVPTNPGTTPDPTILGTQEPGTQEPGTVPPTRPTAPTLEPTQQQPPPEPTQPEQPTPPAPTTIGSPTVVPTGGGGVPTQPVPTVSAPSMDSVPSIQVPAAPVTPAG
ncbi:anti-sigma-D factor RsdA [Nocardia harenae]|uniref:anti-sigma-D factor RsdA n=1 Tax=Nocardia harenae TaxID=358707 RepID=UPI00082A72C9|nr:anti-sigma-D factor RsdA [Nocardia harenae]